MTKGKGSDKLKGWLNNRLADSKDADETKEVHDDLVKPKRNNATKERLWRTAWRVWNFSTDIGTVLVTFILLAFLTGVFFGLATITFRYITGL